MNYAGIDNIIHLLYQEAVAQTQFYKDFGDFVEAKDKQKVINLLMAKANCSYDDAKIMSEHYIDDIPLPSRYTPQEIADFNAKETLYQQTRPRCPICTSTNLSKISGIATATKIGMFGIFGAGDIGKTWKCNNCGSKF